MKFPSLSSTLKLLKPASKAKEVRAKKSKVNTNSSDESQMTVYDKIEEIITIANIDFNSLEIVVKFYNLTEIQQQLTVVTLIEHQMIETLDVILQSEYDVNFLLRGQTPLHYAIKGQGVDIVKLLIKHNANIEYKDIYKETALNSAVRTANTGIIKILLDEGADVNTEASNKSTPLDYAVHQGDIETVNILGQYGALLGSSYLVKNI